MKFAVVLLIFGLALGVFAAPGDHSEYSEDRSSTIAIESNVKFNQGNEVSSIVESHKGHPILVRTQFFINFNEFFRVKISTQRVEKKWEKPIIFSSQFLHAFILQAICSKLYTVLWPKVS